MPTLEELISLQRIRLMQQDAILRAEIRRRLEAVQESLVAQASRLVATDIYNIQKNAVLQQQIQQAITNTLLGIQPLIAENQRAVTIKAAEDLIALLGVQGVQVGIDPSAIERISGAVSQSSPLTKLLGKLSFDSGEAARQTLFSGVSRGENPIVISRQLRKDLDTTKFGAERIARTEVLRAYRGSMRERMVESKSVRGWQWVCSRTASRTCAMCWAMDGTISDTKVSMGTHPNCRCSQAPVAINSLIDIGNGPDLFDALPESNQLRILGPAKFRAYRDGQFELKDLVGEAQSAEWGQVRYEKSLSAVLGQSRAQQYFGRAEGAA